MRHPSVSVWASVIIVTISAKVAIAAPRQVSGVTHVTVRHEKDRCFGWPANGGIWSWGNEILIQYKNGEFQDKPVGSHDINYQKPIVWAQSRSRDGGFTWTHEATTIGMTEPMGRDKTIERARVPKLSTPLDFSDPNIALKFEWSGYLYFSTNRGVDWQGPSQMPMFDLHTWQMRTDYLVEDRRSVLAFVSGSKARFKRDENGGMVYLLKTADGGLTWTRGARVSRTTAPSKTRHDVALMPATVRVSPTKLVCCIRNLTAYPKKGWIDCRISTDNGQTWSLASTPVGNEAGTTPPALTKSPDGRLVLTYGYRKPLKGPTSIRAKISEDEGATWGGELILRTGGGDEDIGYTRNALRPDGKIVTIYYWQEDEKAERDIAATIWTLPMHKSRRAGRLREAGMPLFTNDNAARRIYRLPSLLVTSRGTVVAVSQLRWGPDDFAPQELICRRSEDGGKTWGPEIFIRRDAERKHCRFNGCIVEDAETGKLILHFIEFPSEAGPRWFEDIFLARGGGHYQTESTDNGKTWSEPVLQIPRANAEGWKGASSLNNNHGIQLRHGPHCGRLVMNARVFKPGVTTWRAKGGIVYSDDHGRTWQIGGVPFPNRERYETEACLVETADGGLYINYRNESGDDKARLYHRSADGGLTVSEQGTHNDLPPIVCNAGMTRYSWAPRSILLLTMPVSTGRRDLACFASLDEGRTWPVRRKIASGGGYSDVAVLGDGTILVAYEPDGARTGIVTARFSLKWLVRDTYYYVDAKNGRDANPGTLTAPWRTLKKAADTMGAGDTAFVRAGTYREIVRPQSGQTFAAYKDEKPLITGCDPVSGWTRYADNIYKASVNTRVLDVFIGTDAMQKARWPNEDGDPLTCDEWKRATTSLKSREGRGTGKVVFVKLNKPRDHWAGGWYCGVNGKNPFMVAEGRITASSGAELTCTDLGPGWKGVYGRMWGEGRGYITDHLNCLDADGEWHWQDGSLYFWAPDGGAPTKVEARTRIYGFVMTNRSNVTLKGLYFLGGSVQIVGGRGNVIDGCHFRYVSPWGTHYYTDARNYYWGGTADGTSGIHIAGTSHTIQNSSVVGGWGHGIHLAGGRKLTVSNNTIADFGWSGRFVQSPVSGYGTDLRIERNTIYRSSGPGIFLYQKNPGDGANVNHVKQSHILYNDIRDCGYLLDDSGNAFIYIQNADVPSADRALHGEIAYNIMARQFGGQGKHLTGGIYLDNGTDFCAIHHNVVDMRDTKNKRTAAIFLNAAGHRQDNIFVYHNTLWGYRGDHMFTGGIVLSTNVNKGGRQSNVVIRNNLTQHAPVVRLNDWPYGTSNKGVGILQSHNLAKVPARVFVDAKQVDFRLKSSAAELIDRGVVIPGINDANSTCPFAGSAPDLGAYEYRDKNRRAGATVTPPSFPPESPGT